MSVPTFVEYEATGGQTDFTFPFDYLDTSDVTVSANGTLQTITSHYTFPSPKLIRFNSGRTVGDVIIIRRRTSTDPTAQFSNGSVANGDMLQDAYNQTLFIAQENVDQIGDAITLDRVLNVWEAASRRIANLAAPVNPNDAATRAFVESTAGADPVDPDALLVTATGSLTARTLADRFAGFFNVLDYGAVGDGVANDTTAIQAAIADAVAVGGGVVYFPRGRYLFSGDLQIAPVAGPPNVGSYAIPNNICFQGDGVSVSILHYTGTGTAIKFDGSAAATAMDIRDLSLFGNGAGLIGIHGLQCDFHHNVLRDLRVGGFTQDDIILDNCWNGEAHNIILGGDGITTNNAFRTNNANQWDYVNLYAINTSRGDGAYAFKFEGNTDNCTYKLLQADNVANGIYIKNSLAPSRIIGYWTEKCTNETPGGGTGSAVAIKLEDADNTTIINSQIIWSVSDSIPSITGRLLAIQCINSDNIKVSGNKIFGGGTVSLGARVLDVDSNCNQVEFDQNNQINDNYAVNTATGVWWPRMREDGADVSRISDLKRIQIPHWNRTANAAMMMDADINTDGAFDPALAVLADPAGGQSALNVWSIPDKAADGDVSAVQAAFEIESDLGNVCFNVSLLYCTSGTDSTNVIRVSLIPTLAAEGSDVRGFTQSTVSIGESATEYKLVRVSTLPAVGASMARLANLIVARVSGTSDTSSKVLYIVAATLHKFKADWR